MLLAALSVFLLQFAATKYWLLIVFSFIYGFSDGIFMTSAVYTQLTCVDAKRVTASFCTSNVLYSIAAAAGSPIAGESIGSKLFRILIFLFSQLRSCDVLKESLPFIFSQILYIAITRKVVGKNVHATIPNDNMGYD